MELQSLTLASEKIIQIKNPNKFFKMGKRGNLKEKKKAHKNVKMTNQRIETDEGRWKCGLKSGNEDHINNVGFSEGIEIENSAKGS